MLDGNVKYFSTTGLIPELYYGIFHIGYQIAVVLGQREKSAVNVDFVKEILNVAANRVVSHRYALRVVAARSRLLVQHFVNLQSINQL